jgi:prepilin-type processing-associated H-X9-DG protein
LPIITVTNGAGTSNTLLMAHKIMRTSNYNRLVGGGANGYTSGTSGNGSDPANDDGWVWTAYTDKSPSCCHYDHMRWVDWGACSTNPCTLTTNRGKGYAQDSNNVDENHLGGPHPGGSPVLYADGSVRGYAYGYTDNSILARSTANSGDAAQKAAAPEDAVFQILWCYNRSEVVTAP